ncbi:MAG TPA: hypothetical protein VFH74_16625 [Gaiellales bacterium]|nr:hypothetical protein [Gaiellales bacterium]
MSDLWHCGACGRTVDLDMAPVEVGLVRLAVADPGSFRLGSEGIEDEIVRVLAPCTCGGSFQPGAGDGPVVAVRFDEERLAPLAAAGLERLEADEELSGLRSAWGPRAVALAGRSEELEKEDVLRIRLEEKLTALQTEVERATAAGDVDAAETAHARYIELGTTYVRRFVRPDESAPR